MPWTLWVRRMLSPEPAQRNLPLVNRLFLPFSESRRETEDREAGCVCGWAGGGSLCRWSEGRAGAVLPWASGPQPLLAHRLLLQSFVQDGTWKKRGPPQSHRRVSTGAAGRRVLPAANKGSLSWLGDEGLTKWQILRLHAVLSLFSQSCPTLCNPVDCSTTGFPVHHLPDLLKLVSTESVMPSNHLILCCPLPLPPSIFPSIRVFSNESALRIMWPKYGASASASVLPMNIQDWFPLGWTGWISLLSKGLSRILSNTTVQKHQFFSAQPSLWSNSHIHTWPLEKPQLWLDGLVMSLPFNAFRDLLHLFSNRGSERSWSKVATTRVPHCTLYFLHSITTACDYLASLLTFSLFFSPVGM